MAMKNGMGDDTGTGPDLAGKTAACLCYEYTAACKPYKIGLAAPVATCFGIVLNVIFI